MGQAVWESESEATEQKRIPLSPHELVFEELESWQMLHQILVGRLDRIWRLRDYVGDMQSLLLLLANIQ